MRKPTVNVKENHFFVTSYPPLLVVESLNVMIDRMTIIIEEMLLTGLFFQDR